MVISKKGFVTCKMLGPGKFNGLSNYGLANQMFQIATCINYGEKFNLDAKFPVLKAKKFGGYINNIFRNISTEDIDNIDIEFYQSGFEYSTIPEFKNVRLHGYFQSEKYFVENRNKITELFKPSKDDMEYILEKYGKILKNSVSCHIRLGDYKFLKDDHINLIDSSYYQNSLNQFNSKNTNYLIFSDEINICKSISFLNNKNFYFIENEKDYIDMYIMSMCCNNIIANSSFSWWAAWLNKNPNKKIFAPKNWFGINKKYSTKTLLPNDWRKL